LITPTRSLNGWYWSQGRNSPSSAEQHFAKPDHSVGLSNTLDGYAFFRYAEPLLIQSSTKKEVLLGRRNSIYTEWYVKPHILNIDASADGVYELLSHVRLDGKQTRGRLRRLMACVQYDPPCEGYRDEGIRLC